MKTILRKLSSLFGYKTKTLPAEVAIVAIPEELHQLPVEIVILENPIAIPSNTQAAEIVKMLIADNPEEFAKAQEDMNAAVSSEYSSNKKVTKKTRKKASKKKVTKKASKKSGKRK